MRSSASPHGSPCTSRGCTPRSPASRSRCSSPCTRRPAARSNAPPSSRAFRQSPNPAFAAATARSLRESISINERLQASFAPYISFLILPIFALANAGVRLDGETLAGAAGSPLTWGVVAGLVVGKTVGITAATWIMVRTRIGTLAPGLTMSRVFGGALLSGIGFTISLFIVDIALDDPLQQNEARVGVLLASLVALVLGTIAFRLVDRFQPATEIGRRLVRPFDPARDHYRGGAEASLTLVEYADFECPYCSRATARSARSSPTTATASAT